MTHRILIALIALVIAGPAFAQGPGSGSLPTLELENVTVIGKRNVVLPKARKGEVLDTAAYVLPAGDTLLFAQRISNLGGSGGTLPGYAEFQTPLKLDAEASIGSYTSPRAMLRAEYVRNTYDVGGIVDFRNTAGHTDGAGATSFLAGAHGSVAVGAEDTPFGHFRLSLAAEHESDDYRLYGEANPFDRTRAADRFTLGMQGDERAAVRYGLALSLVNASITDQQSGGSSDASALTPRFNLGLGTDIDSTIAAALRFHFSSTSLRYGTPTQTPASMSVLGEVTWHPSPVLTLAGGIIYASSQHSDSGSSSLLMPRISAQYRLNETLMLFAWFRPELRTASYDDRTMTAPYVGRDITLTPERVPVNLTAGARLFSDTSALMLEVRAFYQQSGNHPVVAAVAGPTSLAWVYTDAHIAGASASARIAVGDRLSMTADATVQSATTPGGEKLPMTPTADLRARADYVIDPAARSFNLFASIAFQTGISASLSGAPNAIAAADDRLTSRVLVGCGASYQVLRNLQAFAGITNLLNYRYDLWYNYSAPGFEVRGGIRIAL
ncbi:MAG TPA: TonB-dependent receptor [Candidatus Kapabacteria bacterium]|nr:TonB-dependent receptor [Candidatus Kapabacteria bacterium]